MIVSNADYGLPALVSRVYIITYTLPHVFYSDRVATVQLNRTRAITRVHYTAAADRRAWRRRRREIVCHAPHNARRRARLAAADEL